MNQAEVLQDQTYRRGRAEVARHEARQVARHHGRAAERRPDQVEHDLRVGAKAGAEDGRLGDRRSVDAHQQLVDQLDDLAGADGAAQTDVLAECLQDRQRAVERRLFAADHDRQGAGLGAGRAA